MRDTYLRTIRVAFFVHEDDEGKKSHSVTLWTTPSPRGPFLVPLEQLQAYEEAIHGFPLNLGTVLGFNDVDGMTKEDLERAVGRAVIDLAAEVNGLQWDDDRVEWSKRPSAGYMMESGIPQLSVVEGSESRCLVHDKPLPCPDCQGKDN